MCRRKKFYVKSNKRCDNCGHREDTEKLNQLKKQFRIRAFIFVLIFLVIFIGLIVPFAAQFVLPFFFSNVSVSGADLWNQYVSIILGVVATILSIVSLYLAFKSEEEANRINIVTQTTLEHIKSKVNNIDENTKATANKNNIVNSYVENVITPDSCDNDIIVSEFPEEEF